MNYRHAFVQALFIFCEERNLDVQQLATLSGFLSFDLKTKGNFNLTNQQLENVWKNIVKLSGDELVGLHFGMSMQIAALHAVGQIIQTSDTVKHALHHACSLIHLFTDFYTMEVKEKSKTFTITFYKNESFVKYATTQNQMGDFLIALTLYELKGLIQGNSWPIQAGLPSYDMKHHKEYVRILKCPVKKADHYFLEFSKENLQTKIITANYEIQNLLLAQINNLQNPNAFQGHLSRRIFNFLIANSYLYSVSIESISGNFNLSVRTLQRKLKEEGVSFIQIMEEVRKSLAIHYIKNSSSSVKEIASILGYAESSGFVRAFKKWTDATPSQYRNKNR